MDPLADPTIDPVVDPPAEAPTDDPVVTGPPPPTNPPPISPPTNHRLVTGPLYDSLEEIVQDVKQWAKDNGFAVVSKGSKKTVKGQLNRVELACAKGPIRPSQATSRHTSTYKTGCKWNARVVALRKNAGAWSFILPNVPLDHNHDAVLDPTALAPLRKLPERAVSLVRSMSKVSAIQPRQIIEVVRLEYPDAVFTAKDISNLRQRFKREDRERERLDQAGSE